MRLVSTLLVVLAVAAEVRAQDVKRDIPYVEKGHERQVLDVYSAPGAKNLPVNTRPLSVKICSGTP